MSRSRSVPEYRDDLPGFLGRLRSELSWSQKKAATYFGVARSTVIRYEKGDFLPKVGYLACLAQLLANRQVDDEETTIYQQELLREVNKAVHYGYRDDYTPTFQNWNELCQVADEYLLAKQRPKSLGLNITPPLDDNFIPRPAETKAVLDLLVDQKRHKSTTLLQGGGGFGKTTLAQAICHEPEIQTIFTDAILWVELGQAPNLLDLLTEQINLLSQERTGFTNLNSAASRWRELLAEHRVLLVLDDVWDEKHVRPFLGGGDHCTTLITTRRQDITTRLKARPVTVNEMTTIEATDLLLKWLDDPPDGRQSIRVLAQYLGEWPLILSLAGAYLRDLVERDDLSLEEAIADLRRRLEEKGFTYLDRADEGERDRAISINLSLSLDRLGQWRERYLELAVFPREIEIRFITLAKLWERTANLSKIDAEDAWRAMQRLSLFTNYNPDKQTIRLHDIIHAYLVEQQKEALSSLHTHLLEAHRPTTPSPLLPDPTSQSPIWADLPQDEPYLWDHLAYHLLKANCSDELVTTAKDLRYLAIKSYLRSAQAAERDLQAAQSEAPDDILHLLQSAFARHGYLLNRCDKLKDLAAALYSLLYPQPALTGPIERLMPANVILPHHPLFSSHPALVRTLTGHSGEVTDCAFSPDGQYIVSAAADKTLIIWDVQTGDVRLTLSEHSNRVTACAYSPDGQHVLSTSCDGTLKVWDAQTGQPVITLRIGSDNNYCYNSYPCAYSPDGRYIAAACGDDTLKIWEARTGEELASFKEENTGTIPCCAFSPDSRYIMAGTSEYLIIWDLNTKETYFFPDLYELTCCAWHPDGRFMLAGSDEGLKEWDVQTSLAEEYRTLMGEHSDWHDAARGCAYSPDGHYILAAFGDATLKVWAAQTGQELLTLTGHADMVNACAYSPDGRYIVSASADKTLKMWDTRVEYIPTGHAGKVTCCAYSPDGRHMVTGSEDSTLIVWNTQTGREHIVLAEHSDEEGDYGVYDCAFSPDGKRIVSASYQTLKVWDAQTGRNLFTLARHLDWVTGCTFNPSGQYILSASLDKTLKVWDARTEHEHRNFSEDSHLVTCAYSPNEKHILTASYNRIPKIRDAWTGQETVPFKPTTEAQSNQDNQAESNPFKNVIFIGHTKETENVQAGRKRITFSDFTNRVKCVYSPDGRYILSAFADKTLKVWEARTGQEWLTLHGHSDRVTGCAFSPDGRLIASTSADQTLKVWDVSAPENSPTERCLATFPVERNLNSCAWSPDGHYLVAVGDGGIYFLQFIS